jgi:hypothetical protein
MAKYYGNALSFHGPNEVIGILGKIFTFLTLLDWDDEGGKMKD